VRRKALAAAAELLQALPEALDIVAGEIVRKDGKPGPSISLGAIAQNLAPTAKARGDREPGLAADGWFKTEHQVYPYGSHVAVVRVDAETGHVVVERYCIAYDIGRAINPALVRGQIVGGYAQGLGGALFEEFSYSTSGDPLAATFADYLLPALHEVPAPDVLLREDYTSPLNPLGIKGAGESGITAVGATIASAIDDAIGIPGAVRQLPITPQRLRRLLSRYNSIFCFVMPAPVAGIHVFQRSLKTWMAGTSPAMTAPLNPAARRSPSPVGSSAQSRCA